MGYLIDTNVIAELRKGSKANVGVAQWFSSVESSELYLSTLVVGEIRRGIANLQRRDPPSAARLEAWLIGVLASHADRIHNITLPIAECWGRLNVPDPLPVVDGLLAATALVHDLTLVTRNVKDVARTGVRILNPFADT